MFWVVDRHNTSGVTGVTLLGDPGMGSSRLLLAVPELRVQSSQLFISPSSGRGLRCVLGVFYRGMHSNVFNYHLRWHHKSHLRFQHNLFFGFADACTLNEVVKQNECVIPLEHPGQNCLFYREIQDNYLCN